jgi:hypothetical protein
MLSLPLGWRRVKPFSRTRAIPLLLHRRAQWKLAPMEDTIQQTGSWTSIVSSLLFLTVAASITLHCYRNSMFDIDLLGYSGTVALLESGDIVKGHSLVYREPLTAHLRGLDDNGKQAMDMRRRAADPYYAAVFLPYFAIKPLYVLTLQVVHKAGLSVIDASRAVSVLFYFGIAGMLWLYTRSLLSLVILMLPETMLLGQANEPDGMSCFFLLLGFWLVFVKRRDMGLLVLVLSIWVRPENSLLCLLVIIVLLVEGRLDLRKAAVLALLCVGSEVLINHFGYPWKELYSHLLTGDPGSAASFRFSLYFVSLAKGVRDMLHGAAPVFGLLWLVCFPLVDKELKMILGLTLVFSVGRFLVFPPYEPRYYPLFFMTTSIAAVVVVKNTSWREWFWRTTCGHA